MEFTYKDKDYSLDLTRARVREAETAYGLSSSLITDKPFTALGLLFFAALKPSVATPKRAVEMLDELLDSGELKAAEVFEFLVKQYTDLFGLGESE